MVVCLIISCRTALPRSWAHSLMWCWSLVDIVFTGNCFLFGNILQSNFVFRNRIVWLGMSEVKCCPMDFFDDKEVILKHKGLWAVRGGGKIETMMVDEWVREFLVLVWVEVIDALSMVVKMTDSLKTSMSSILTSTLLMEAASYDFGNAETQITTRPGRSCWIGKTIL